MMTRFSMLWFLSILSIASLAAFDRQTQASVITSQEFDFPIPSPDDPDSRFGKGKMKNAVIDVTEHFSINDLDIAVTLTHGAFFDLEIMLKNPAGTAITLNPHSNPAFIITNPDEGNILVGGLNRFLFDDESEIAIEQATGPWNQSFKPANGFNLSVFDGQDAFGQWQVQITDLWPAQTGRLHSVELIFETPEPNSICLLALAGAIARLRRNRKNHR